MQDTGAGRFIPTKAFARWDAPAGPWPASVETRSEQDLGTVGQPRRPTRKYPRAENPRAAAFPGHNEAMVVSALLFLTVTEGAQKLPLPDIYPAPDVARSQIQSALKSAAISHKRVILDFGGNWCGDCRALDHYLQLEPNASIVKADFLVVHVNIGRFDQNKDVAQKYGVPLAKGVPALAVLDSNGRPLFSQKKGEFESMRSMDPSSVTEFLNHWKPSR